uniref:Uncharacterized protein n=1 Tax=Anopheles maculatus TaxID=74869 RepID=A0A182T339_9DIPT
QNKEEKEFKCPIEQGNGNFADPVTCRRFYQVRSNIRDGSPEQIQTRQTISRCRYHNSQRPAKAEIRFFSSSWSPWTVWVPPATTNNYHN